MSKQNHLPDIFSLLSHEPVNQKNHFMFLLGTDTVFTKRPTIDKTYEDGETLSYAAQVITNLLEEEAEIDSSAVLSYSSESVDLLNGPTTLGTEVGQRVAQAVFLALRAIASGKETINFPAHSRGAVQAIMVVNELERIKKALAEHPESSLFEILKQAPTKEDNTGIAKAVCDMFAEAEETATDRKNLLEKLRTVKFNTFLIDPVPGGSKLGLKNLRWHSSRFYEKLECENCEILLMEHEFTSCFTPIVPEGTRPLVLPGHHGTASGNRYNQQYKPVPNTINNRDTTTVQSLVLCKLFYFLNNCTKNTDYPNGLFSQERYKQYNLEHPKLDETANSFLRASDSERRSQLLTHYNKTQENIEAYRWFSEGSYAVLGRQFTEDKRRYVHWQGRRHSSMSDVAPNINGQFLNQEHALLYLREFVNLDHLLNSSIDEAVKQINILLGQTVNQLLAPHPEQDEKTAKLVSLLESKDGCELFFSGLSLLVEMISQKYLTNHLTVEQDEALRSVIEEPFHMLSKAKETDNNHPAIHQMDKMIKEGLKNTVEKHAQSIFQQIDFIETQISHIETLPEPHFQDVFNYFIAKLGEGANASEGLAAIPQRLDEVSNSAILFVDEELDSVLQANDVSEELTLIQKELENASPTTINDIEKAIDTALRTVLPNTSPEKIELLENIVSRKADEFLKPCFDAHEISIEDYLKNIEHLYNLVITLQKDLPSLQKLADNSIKIVDQQVRFRKLALIEMGGRLLKSAGFDLRNPPNYLSETFFNLIKGQAIFLGAIDPELEDLTTELQEKTDKAEDNARHLHSAQETLKNKERVFENLIQKKNTRIKALKTENERAAQEKLALEQTLVEKNYQIEAQGQRLEQLQRIVGEKNTLIEQLTSEKEQEYAALIQVKLLPLTNDYLNHLFSSAKKYNQDLGEMNDLLLPNLDDSHSPETREHYQAIQNKFALVQALKNHLKDTTNHPLPSHRVHNFKTDLEQAEALTVHRDAKWKRYAASCSAALAIIVTGIIPGLITLLIYSKVSGKGNPLFFNHFTRGEVYRSQCNSELSSIPPGEAPAAEEFAMEL